MGADRYAELRRVLDDAIEQASGGKGAERHDPNSEPFEDQQIVQLCEWMGSNQGDIFQACKKAVESVGLPPERARAELLGAINYLAAAVLVLDRRDRRRTTVENEVVWLVLPRGRHNVGEYIDSADVSSFPRYSLAVRMASAEGADALVWRSLWCNGRYRLLGVAA